MKRLLSVVLILALCFGISSCSKSVYVNMDNQAKIIGSWFTEIINNRCMAISFNRDSTFSATSVDYSSVDNLIIKETNGTYTFVDDTVSLFCDEISASCGVTIMDNQMFWDVDGFNQFHRVTENSNVQGEWKVLNPGDEIKLVFGGRFCLLETITLYNDGTYIIKDSREEITNRGRYSIINDNTTLSLDDYFYFTYVLHDSAVLLLTLEETTLVFVRRQ